MITLRTKVLVVEDNPTLRTLLCSVLSASGYGVQSSHDGFSALKTIRREMPDIVLSDLYMTGMSGFELLSVVRRKYPALRVVAMSSNYVGKCVPAGIDADAFYQKATNIQSLLTIIAEIQQIPQVYPARPYAPAPIWIATLTDGSSGEACVSLSCAECLRAFSAPLDQDTAGVHEALCPFCSMPTRYALVQPQVAEA